MLPNGPDWPSCLGGGLKSYREISIFLIFLWSSHQVDMKKVFKTSLDFFCYFKASDSHCDSKLDVCKYVDYSSELKSMPTKVPAFFAYNNFGVDRFHCMRKGI